MEEELEERGEGEMDRYGLDWLGRAIAGEETHMVSPTLTFLEREDEDEDEVEEDEDEDEDEDGAEGDIEKIGELAGDENEREGASPNMVPALVVMPRL